MFLVGFSILQEFYLSGLGVSDFLALRCVDVKEELKRVYALMPKLNTKENRRIVHNFF
jgi:hypothetical protein